MSNKNTVAAWFKTSCSSPQCSHSSSVVSGLHGTTAQSLQLLTAAAFHLELDFCLTKQLQVLIHVGVSTSPCFNESGHKGGCKCPSRKRLTTLVHMFFLVCVALLKTSSDPLCLMGKQHLKTNGKYFQFKGSFEDVTLNQQSESLQLAAH